MIKTLITKIREFVTRGVTRSVCASCFSFIVPCNWFIARTVATIPAMQSSHLNQYLASVLIHLPKGDDVFLEARDEEDTNMLDLLSFLGGEHHNVTHNPLPNHTVPYTTRSSSKKASALHVIRLVVLVSRYRTSICFSLPSYPRKTCAFISD
jgi:hypothetical protein